MQDIYSFLQDMGRRSVEGVALLAGTELGDSFTVTHAIIPGQRSYQLEAGLLYAVEGAELHRINVWLHQNRLRLIAQIHSHPYEAYHSETDDRYPIVDTHGSISIVLPNFAEHPENMETWAVYRLDAKKGWMELDDSEIRSLIQLV